MLWWSRPALLSAIQEEAAEDEATNLVEDAIVTFFAAASRSKSPPPQAKLFPVLPPLSNFAPVDYTLPGYEYPRHIPTFVPRDADWDDDDDDGDIDEDRPLLATLKVPLLAELKTEDAKPNTVVVPPRTLVDAAVNTDITMDDILYVRRNERLSPTHRGIVVFDDDVVVPRVKDRRWPRNTPTSR